MKQTRKSRAATRLNQLANLPLIIATTPELVLPAVLLVVILVNLLVEVAK